MLHSFRVAATAALIALLAAGPAPAGQGAIAGSVVDQQSGLPVSGAAVTLYQGNTVVAATKTGPNGSFGFAGEPAGLYDLDIDAQGYQRSRVSDEALAAADTLAVRIVLPRASSAQNEPSEIGRTSTTSSRNALATTTVINRSISADTIAREGLLRAGDALLKQPGLTSFNLDSAPGDDLNISIRGQRPSEAQALIDGHPIGPVGVFNGTGGGFNYQLSPSFALSSVQITYGTGGSALTGVDAIAGTIDFLTLGPTQHPESTLRQGFGTQGRAQTVASATGTAGKLGYALVGGVEGTYGGFAPRTISQTGLLGNDVTAANVAANTWLVSGNYVLRNDLFKLRYALSPTTSLTATAYIGTSWDDKTGQGDNDFATPEFVLYGAQNGGGTACTTAAGGAGYVVATDANPTACFTPAQYAAALSGPAGGTALAFQTQHLQDYSAHLNTTLGRHTVELLGFANQYSLYYNRNGGGFINQYWTLGERISDDIVTEANTFGVGYSGLHQLYTSTNYKPASTTAAPGIFSSVGNVFVRDIFNATPHLQIFANANLKSASVSQQTTFDPRLSLVFRPTAADVYRISAGRGNEAPTAQLKSGAPNVSTQPGALNPNCGLNSIGTAPNTALTSENAKELEVSYGHKFRADSQIQVVGYDSEIANAIFSNVLPLTSFGPGAVPSNLSDYLNRITTIGRCSNVSIANLGLTTAANAGGGRFRGIDITGRARLNRNVYLDLGYDMISARYFGIPAVSLKRNVTLIDGGQISAVPFQKANLGVDYTVGGTELRIDGYYVGRNNGLYRPAYTFADGFISHRFAHDVRVNLGVSNIFNSQHDQYGRIGYASFQPENQYGTDATALDQAINGNGGERFGLPERSFMLTFSARVR